MGGVAHVFLLKDGIAKHISSSHNAILTAANRGSDLITQNLAGFQNTPLEITACSFGTGSTATSANTTALQDSKTGKIAKQMLLRGRQPV